MNTAREGTPAGNGGPTAPPAAGAPEAVPGIAIDWLFDGKDVRITRWRCLSRSPELSEERHQPWHVLGFLHSGAFVLHTRGRSVVIDSTCVLFTSPFIPYRTAHPFGCGDHGSSLVVRPGLLLEIMAEYDTGAIGRGPDAPFPQIYGPSSPRAHLLQRLTFQRLAGGEAPDPMALEETALLLADAVIGDSYRQVGLAPHTRPGTARAHRDCVEAAKALLVRRFTESLHLRDIAREVRVSPFHLSRVFKQETGLPIHRYLNRLRLRAALERVADHGTDLTGLAFDLGFSSHSHFTASFGQEFGLPPSAVQELVAAGRLSDLARTLARRPARTALPSPPRPHCGGHPPPG